MRTHVQTCQHRLPQTTREHLKLCISFIALVMLFFHFYFADFMKIFSIQF